MWKKLLCYLQNPCASSPCQHPSVLCQAGFTDRGYRCVCNKTGFVGEKCEKGKAYTKYNCRTEIPLQKRLRGLERKKVETSMSDARKIKIDHSPKGTLRGQYKYQFLVIPLQSCFAASLNHFS